MNNIETQKRSGFTLSIDPHTKSVVSVTDHSKKFSVGIGQLVRASGKRGASKGTTGTVTCIHLPFSGQRTTNILDVKFEGAQTSKPLKFEDLLF
ncbi:MAG TPA: hypothetical protein VJA28_02905 [Patescibacteria group bacterium]|nr:hypothetical protein [Patescibacteria group bacterium]